MSTHETPQQTHDRLLALIPQGASWPAQTVHGPALVFASSKGYNVAGTDVEEWDHHTMLAALFQPVETWTEITPAQARDLASDVVMRGTSGTVDWRGLRIDRITFTNARFFVHPDDAPPTNPDEALADLLDSELGSITKSREDYLNAARLIRAHIEAEDKS